MIIPALKSLLDRRLSPLRIRDRTMPLIVQGCMGIGVSAHGQAGAIAAP